MNTQYEAQVITLSKHMDEVASVEGISYEHPTHGKKLLALHNAMTALSKLYNKSMEQVYDDISEYASWISLQNCIVDANVLVDAPVVIAA